MIEGGALLILTNQQGPHTADPRRFLTIDHWASREAYQAFRQRYADEYRQVDEQLAPLCARETPLGRLTPEP